MTSKLKMHSPDLTEDNIAKIAALFPNCISESRDEQGRLKQVVDFDLLRQELSDVIVEGEQERYRLDWVGKKEAILAANAPIAKTLRPSREESVNFDTTENLFIEGDNLDALKLLQENYLGKVKMIYIDPPYNTGKDFIYNDDFAESSKEFFTRSQQFDEEGNRLIANTESNGRFHSDWLSMMYSRLKLARNLLADDGVIFISCDNNEQANLKRLCDEVFGEKNSVTQITWQKKTGASDAKGMATITEFILIYTKTDIGLLSFSQNTHSFDMNRYKYRDKYFDTRGAFYYDNLDRGTLGYIESLDFPILAPDGTAIYPNNRTEQFNDGWRWKWSKAKVEQGIKNGFIEIRKNSKTKSWGVYYKIYHLVDNEGNLIVRSAPHKNLILDILNTHAANDAKDLFGKTGLFSNPKPITLISKILSFIKFENNELVLDFFAGSATTAHAVMQLNAEDGGNRRFIMVQLPELTDEKSEAFKAGYPTIAEISKERIRRAAAKICTDFTDRLPKDWDGGFRVLKVDSTNMKEVYYRPDEVSQSDLLDMVSHIKEDRSGEDLLFQVMLDWGLPLSLPIQERDVDGKKVYFVGEKSSLGYALAACFDELNEAVIQAVAAETPQKFVSVEYAISKDADKTNIKEWFKQLSPETDVKFI